MSSSAEQVRQWQRLSPLSVVFFLFGFVRQIVTQGLPALAVAFAGIAQSERFGLPLVLAGAGLLLLAVLAGAVLTWLRFRYRLSVDRVLVRRGVIKREELDIEFDRIQNINILEPFYMRPFGLAVLAIDTAGSAGKEVKVAGVALGRARSLRSTILGKSPDGAIAPLADAPAGADSAPVQTLVELGRRDVLIYGLTANFMLWFLVAIGAVFSAGDSSEALLEWLASRIQLDHWLDLARQNGGSTGVAIAFAGTALAVMLLLPALSMIGALFRYDGFRLDVEEETYRKSSGLLTRHDESIKQHKIQAVVWKQNLMATLFGRVNLQLRQASAGAGIEDGQLPSGAKSQFLVPSLRPAEAEAMSAEFLPGCSPEQARYSRINRRSYMRVNLLIWMMPLSLQALLFATLLDWKIVLVVPIAAGILYLVFNRRWLRFGYAVDGETGYFRSGFIGSVITMFPLFKIQRVDVRQTPMQRRRGLAHLTVHLASHSLEMPYMPAADAFALRDYALFAAESSRCKWY